MVLTLDGEITRICEELIISYARGSSAKPYRYLHMIEICTYFNTLRPKQNGRHFADDIFKCIFLNENVRILIKISLKFVPKGPINNIPALVQIMAWRRPGDKPLSEPVMFSLLTHICITRSQWVNCSWLCYDCVLSIPDRFIHHFTQFHQGCFTDIGANTRLPRYQRSNHASIFDW